MTDAMRGYSAVHNPAGVLPEHWVIRLTAGAVTTRSLVKATGADSLDRCPPRETIDTYVDRLAASVVVNASGWWGTATEDGDLMGAQILNGRIVKDWEIRGTAWVGTRAVAFMQDGTLRLYDYGTPVDQILADGAWNTFCQGAIAIQDGEPTTFATSSTYLPLSARSLLGADARGDLYLIVIPGKSGVSGATGQQVLDIVAPLALDTLIVLDSGGSVQLAIEGRTVVHSSDATPRRIPDVLAFTAPRTARLPADWQTIPDRADGWEAGTVRWLWRDGQVTVHVDRVTRTGAPKALAPICVLPPEVPRPPSSWPELAYLNTRPAEAQNARISTTGSVDVTTTATGSVYVTFTWPA